VGANPTRRLMVQHRRSRIRQDGTIKELEFYVGTLTGYTSLVFSAWRWTGSTYTRVGSCENLISRLTPNALNRVKLGQYIVNASEGDYGEFALAGTPGSGNILVGTASGTGKSNLWDAQAATDTFNWETAAAVADTHVQFKAYMDTPQFAAIGDSWTAGVFGHRSFIEDRDVSEDHTQTDVTGTWERQFFLRSGWTYQNVGVGGEDSITTAARLADALDTGAQGIFVHTGWNNVRGGSPDFNAYMTSITGINNAIKAAGRIHLHMEPSPLTGEPNANHVTMDTWFTSAKGAIVGGGGYVVPMRYLVGQPRAGGATGNRWDITTGMAAGDNIHPNNAGKQAIAQAMYEQTLMLLGPSGTASNMGMLAISQTRSTRRFRKGRE